MKATRAVCTAYVSVCIVALLLTAATGLGWLARGPAGALSDVLSAPWSLFVGQMQDPGAVGELVLVAAAMALNLAIISSIGKWIARRTLR